MDLSTGWVTVQKIPLHDGGVILVQKKNGSTRSIIEPAPRSKR